MADGDTKAESMTYEDFWEQTKTLTPTPRRLAGGAFS